MRTISEFCKDQAGTTPIEYSVIASAIALAIIASVTSIGGYLKTLFTTLQGLLL